jgi:hypothetical protein
MTNINTCKILKRNIPILFKKMDIAMLDIVLPDNITLFWSK